MISFKEILNESLNESISSDYYVEKTTDQEVKDLLLRGHYLGAWPFSGSKYKDYIYGIYYRLKEKQADFPGMEDNRNKDLLIGTVVYGYPESHASGYIAKQIRGLLDPEETSDEVYQNLKRAIEKDQVEKEKASKGGYQFKAKSTGIIKNILNATNLQDKQILELKRLYILPEYDIKNIESFAISQGNKMVFDNNPYVQVILSFSDAKVGHYGGVYQATNAAYAGQTKHKLHRYIYLRRELENLIKKYRKDYEALVYSYPEKIEKDDTIKQKPLSDFDALTPDKKERAILRWLKNKQKTTTDNKLLASIEDVINSIEKSPQTAFSLAENIRKIREIVKYVIRAGGDGATRELEDDEIRMSGPSVVY